MTNPRRLQHLREDSDVRWAPLRALVEALTPADMGAAEKQKLRDTLEAAIAESLAGDEEELHAVYARG